MSEAFHFAGCQCLCRLPRHALRTRTSAGAGYILLFASRKKKERCSPSNDGSTDPPIFSPPGGPGGVYANWGVPGAAHPLDCSSLCHAVTDSACPAGGPPRCRPSWRIEGVVCGLCVSVCPGRRKQKWHWKCTPRSTAGRALPLDPPARLLRPVGQLMASGGQPRGKEWSC
jgi:hypothetical protein